MPPWLFPRSDPSMITESDIPVGKSPDVTVLGSSRGRTLCRVSSGEYEFKSGYSK